MTTTAPLPAAKSESERGMRYSRALVAIDALDAQQKQALAVGLLIDGRDLGMIADTLNGLVRRREEELEESGRRL